MSRKLTQYPMGTVFPVAQHLGRAPPPENYRDLNGQLKTGLLQQQAIPHAAIPDSTNHFFLVHTQGESEFDLAGSIQGFQLRGGELQRQTGEIVLELSYLPRSDDRDYRYRSIA